MRRDSRSYLFRRFDLDHELGGRVSSIQSEVDAIDKNTFLSTPADVIESHIVNRLLLEPLRLQMESMVRSEAVECSVDVSSDTDRYFSAGTVSKCVSGVRFKISIPFTGDAMLWEGKTNPYFSSVPFGDVESYGCGKSGVLVLRIEVPSDMPKEKVKSSIDSNIELINEYIKNSNVQVVRYNQSLLDNVKRAVDARYARLKLQDNIVGYLDIPVERSEGAPSFSPIYLNPIVKRPLPAPSNTAFVPEPGISDKIYGDILSLLRYTGTSFERTPHTYKMHGEEDLRNIMLSNLNGVYRGGAGGEVFRVSGKTDIHISEDGKSAFIGECKIWSGKRAFLEAIDQLFSYLTWRDCKVALIVFNKDNKSFGKILEVIPASVHTHELFVKDNGKVDDNEWSYVLRLRDDESRYVKLHVMAFNLCAP